MPHKNIELDEKEILKMAKEVEEALRELEDDGGGNIDPPEQKLEKSDNDDNDLTRWYCF